MGECAMGKTIELTAADGHRFAAYRAEPAGKPRGAIAAHAEEKTKAPTMLHFGETDQSIPMSDVEKVRAAHPEIKLYVYKAGHGFNCDERGSYDAESTRVALDRTLGFLREHLG